MRRDCYLGLRGDLTTILIIRECLLVLTGIRDRGITGIGSLGPASHAWNGSRYRRAFFRRHDFKTAAELQYPFVHSP